MAEFKLTFEDGSDGYLEHFGVKGMHWGVRNAETIARYAREGSGPKPSKRQMKKHIKNSKKAYRKETGSKALLGYTDVGPKTAAVAKEHKKTLASDENWQKASKKTESARSKMYSTEEDRDIAEDYYTRLNKEDSGATYLQKDKAKKAYIKAEARFMNATEAYNKAKNNQRSIEDKVAKHYVSKYETAAVEDLGFKNVEAGKALLNEYGLMRKASRTSWNGLRYESPDYDMRVHS